MPLTGETHLDALRRTEGDTGRTFALDHQYYRWDGAFPGETEADDRRTGRTPFLNWAPRMEDATTVPWRSIAAGEHDAVIAARAADLRTFGAPVLLRFSGTPYDQSMTGWGTPAEFAEAFRRVVTVLRASGATNVSFAFVMDGDDFTAGRADPFYPGDAFVDWVGASAFNQFQRTSRWDTVPSLLAAFVDWAGPRHKTAFVPEFASEEDPADPDRKARWLDEAREFLRSQPQLRAAVYFNANGMRGGDGFTHFWNVDSSTASLGAWRRLATDSWFEQ
jgi:hypothetical protein